MTRRHTFWLLSAFLWPVFFLPICRAGSLPGNNVALNKPVTPHSTIQRGTPAEVNDGTIFTLWYSYFSSEAEYECRNCIRFTIDLEAEYDIRTIAIYLAQTWRVKLSSSSDGNTWVQRASRDWGGSYGGATRFDFPAGFQARYLMYEGDADWPQWLGVTEFEVYDDSPAPMLPAYGTRNLAVGTTATISDDGCSSTTPPTNALDGNPATTWKPSCKSQSDANAKWGTWGFIQIDLGDVYNLGKVVVKPVSYQYAYFSLSEEPDAEYQGGYNHSFIAFDQLVSEGRTSNQEAAVYFNNVAARYIRVFVVNFEVEESDLVELAEIEVFEASDASSVFLGPVAGERWTRSIRVDSNGNGKPDPDDETIDVIREPASMNYLTFVSPRWGSTIVEMGNPDAQTGDFSSLIHRRPQSQIMTALGRQGVVPEGPSTTTEVTIFSIDQLDQTLRPSGVSFERTKVRRGVPSVRTGEGVTMAGGFEFQRNDQPKVSLSFVYEDVNADGNADFASIPWAMAQVLGVNLVDATVDPQVWVPLGDTNGDGIPDSPAFDFDNDNLADPNLPLTPALSGPSLADNSEYHLGFAQFADGTAGSTQFFSEIFLLGLVDEASMAEVTIRRSNGDLFPLTLDGQAFSGNGNFMIPAGGMRVLASSGQGSLSAGSVRIRSQRPLAGVTTYFSEGFGAAGVGASPRLGHGFVAPISRRLSQQVEMGVAVRNLEDREISLVAELFDSEGGRLGGAAAVALLAQGQTARLLGEFEWDFEDGMIDAFDGLLKVSSNGLVGATVIQTSPGEYATMPVVSNLNPQSVVQDPLAQPSAQLGLEAGSNQTHLLLFPQFANGSVGESWIRSKIFLFSQDATGTATTRISIRNSRGSLLSVRINGEDTGGEVEVSVPPNGLRILETEGGAGSFASGSVLVASDRSISGTLVYSSSFGIAGVGNSAIWKQGFLGPMQTDQNRQVDTGIAVMNLEDEVTNLRLELYSPNGALLATTAASLPAQGQSAKLLSGFDWNPTLDLSSFTGLIKVDSGGARVAGTIIQLRPNQYLTMPVAPRLH